MVNAWRIGNVLYTKSVGIARNEGSLNNARSNVKEAKGIDSVKIRHTSGAG